MRHDPLFDLNMDVEPPWRERAEPGSSPGEPPGSGSAMLSLSQLVRRNAALICGCAVAVAIAAFLLSMLMAERYSSSASLLFRQSELVGQVTGFAEGRAFDTIEEQGATNVAVVESRPVALETSRRMGGDYDLEALQSAITVEARPNTSVVDVTAEASTPEQAVRLANTYTQVFVDQRARQVRREISGALSRLEQELALIPESAREGTVAAELEQRISTLRVLNAVQSPNVEPIQRAELPEQPSSPRPKRNAVLGLLFGLLLGLGLAALRQHLSSERARQALE